MAIYSQYTTPSGDTNFELGEKEAATQTDADFFSQLSRPAASYDIVAGKYEWIHSCLHSFIHSIIHAFVCFFIH